MSSNKKLIITISAGAVTAFLHELILLPPATPLDLTTLIRAGAVCALYAGLGWLLHRLYSQQPPAAVPAQTKILETNFSADALSSLGLMTAGLAHMFNNYLEVIEQTSQVLARFNDSHASIKRAVVLQKRCLKQAKDTAHQILWFANRDQAQPFTARPVNAIVKEALELAELLVQDKQIEIVADFEDAPLNVKVNEISLMQSVVNLVRSAAQASACGSRVLVSTRYSVHQHTVEFCVVIRDFGPRRSRHEEPAQSKPDCSALGYLTVKQLVELDGGKLSVESDPASGTEVVLHYPILQ